MAEAGSLRVGDLGSASARIPPDKPYVMMNMLKFHSVAQYPDSSQEPGSKSLATGREAYAVYRDLFTQRARELGVTSAEVVFAGEGHTNIIAGVHEGESWDVVLLVRFKDFAAFRSVLDDRIYLEKIQPHRLAALQDFRSFAVTDLSGL